MENGDAATEAVVSEETVAVVAAPAVADDTAVTVTEDDALPAMPCKPLPQQQPDDENVGGETQLVFDGQKPLEGEPTTSTDGATVPVNGNNGDDHHAEQTTTKVNGDAKPDADAAAVAADATVVDADGYHVEERHETELTNRTEEVRERPDGAEEVVLHETRSVVMEEVKSKETERSATEEEMKALLEAKRASGNVEEQDGVVEISLGKDTLVEEFTRTETTHEQTVDGETTVTTTTVTEDHKTEEVHEVPVTLTNGSMENGIEKPTETFNGVSEDAAAATEPEVTASPEAAAPLTVETDLPEAAVSAPSPSQEDGKAKGEKSPKSKGFIGFLKSKARSQSRERDETAGKEEQKPKDGEPEKPKSSTLEREQHKKFKLNLFGKKSEDEKAEKTDDEKEDGGHAEAVEKEAVEKPPKHSKMTLFGKKKEKSTDDGHEKKDGEKEAEAVEGKVEDADVKGKDKERKWYHFGKKPAKENTPAAAEVHDGETVPEDAAKDKPEGDAEVKEGTQEAEVKVETAVTEASLESAVAVEGPEVTVEVSAAPEQAPKVAEDAAVDSGDEKIEKDVSPGGTLKSDGESKEASGGKVHKKFSFGLKFGKKHKVPKSESTDDNKAGATSDKDEEVQSGPETEAVNGLPEGEAVASKAPEEKKEKKHKMFSFGKILKSKSRDGDVNTVKNAAHEDGDEAKKADEVAKDEEKPADAAVAEVGKDGAEEPVVVASEETKEEKVEVAVEVKVEETAVEEKVETATVAVAVEAEVPAGAVEVEQEQKVETQQEETPAAPVEEPTPAAVEETPQNEVVVEATSPEVEVKEVTELQEAVAVAAEVPAEEEKVAEVHEESKDEVSVEKTEEVVEKVETENIVEETVERREEVQMEAAAAPPAEVEPGQTEAKSDEEVTTVAAAAEAEPEAAKKEHKEGKKFSFGIKFGQKKEAKSEETTAGEEKHKETHWSPFSKKPAKKPAAAEAAAEKPVEVDAEEVGKEEKPQEAAAAPEEANAAAVEPTEEKKTDEPKEHKKDEATMKIKMPKLFSFGKKEKMSTDKPAEVEAKEGEAAGEAEPAAEPEAAAVKSEGDEEEAKKPEGAETTEKKEEPKKATGIRKLFSLGKRGKEGEEKKEEGEQKEAVEGEDTAKDHEARPSSPEGKPKSRSKSPHKKFSFDLKLGKKKDKEEAEKKEQAAVEKAEEKQPETVEVKEVVVAVEAGVAVEPQAAVAEEAQAEQPVVEVEVSSAVESSTLEAAPAVEEPVPTVEVSKPEVQINVEETVVVEKQVEEQLVVEEKLERVESAPVVEAQLPAVEVAAETEKVAEPVAAVTQEAEVSEPQATAEAAPKEEKPAEAAAESGKERKGRRRFPFNFRFGRRSERAKSAERAQSMKPEDEEKAEKAKPIETSASVPDVHMHATAYEDADQGVEGETAEKPKDVEKTTATDTPSRIKESLSNMHFNIKWPHFGRKTDKQQPAVEAVPKEIAAETVVATESQQTAAAAPEAAEEVQAAAEATSASASASASKTTDSAESTPKKQQQTPQSEGSAKKSLLGKGGLLKGFFSPRKEMHKSPTTVSEADDKEPVVSYSVEPEGQIVAETQWRPKSAASTSSELRLSKSVSLGASTGVIAIETTAPEVDGAGQTAAPGHFVVVAIDFGTTYSGYAFSFARDARSAAGQAGGIHMMRRWEGGDPGVVNQKTPTTMLLTPTGEFHSFGFTARDFYHDLDPAEAGRWMYFEKFKMTLHQSTELNAETTITSGSGREFPALQLFALALRYFKEHALKELSSQSATIIVNEDVRWVITVPAIWKAPAKQFMRQAAYEAGIASAECPDNLLIALEPEAASIYVRQLRLSQLVPDRHSTAGRPVTPHREPPTVDGQTTTSAVVVNGDGVKETETPAADEQLGADFHAGTRYMVVDCGGGTVDITVHEMENDSGNLRELYKATGGPYGSTGVDREFEKLLGEIFGVEFIEAFKSKRPAGWVDLMIAFESRKRAASPHKATALNVSLPFSFIDFHKKHFGTQVESAIKRYADKDIHWSMQGMLRFMPDAMMKLFQPTLESIRNAIKQVLACPDVTDIEYLFLVGGFSESPILQFEIRKEFEKTMKIIIPQEVSLTILKGAVCFGLDPTVVTVRRSRLTYGVGVMNRFVRGTHPESKLVRRGGGDSGQPESEWCRDVFDRFVFADQPVALGDTVLRRYTPAERDQSTTIIHIYSSENPDVHFVTDDGVQQCGTLRLELPTPDECGSADRTATLGGSRRREIQTRMTFGDTEIKVWALDVASGRSVRAAIDFLNK